MIFPPPNDPCEHHRITAGMPVKTTTDLNPCVLDLSTANVTDHRCLMSHL